MQELRKTLEDDKQDISLLNSISKQLLTYSREPTESRSVTERCRNVTKKREELERAIDGRIASLEKQVDKASEFYRVNEMIEEWIPKTEQLLDERAPASKEPNEVKAEMKQLEVT